MQRFEAWQKTPVRTTFVHVIERSKNTNIFTTGEAIERRFYDTDDVSSLFDFVSASYWFDSESDDDDHDTSMVEFCLVTRGGFGVGENQKRIYMPSIASLGARGSLGAAGVRSGDVFFVEKVALS